MPHPSPRSGLRCAATPVAGKSGRWRLNSGARMLQCIAVDGACQLVDVVLDLSTVRFAREKITALMEHWGAPIGNWSGASVTPTGPGRGLYADLALYTDSEEQEQPDNVACARMVAALMAQGHEWEASIGEDTRSASTYELVMPGTSVVVNGESIYADPASRPLVIARNVTINEASIVTHGADAGTGRIAAALITPPAQNIPKPKEPSMDKILAALVAKHPEAHHGLIARMLAAGKTEADIETAIQASILKAKDDEIAALKASLEQAKQTPPAVTPSATVTPPTGVQASAKAPETASDTDKAAPKTLLEAAAILRKEGLKGSANVAERRRRWPHLVA